MVGKHLLSSEKIDKAVTGKKSRLKSAAKQDKKEQLNVSSKEFNEFGKKAFSYGKRSSFFALFPQKTNLLIWIEPFC